MPDVAKLAELMQRFEGTSLSIHPERCVPVRNRNAVCTRCQEACPTHAITCEGNSLDIDPDLCDGCAVCTTVCPTAALLPLEPTFAELLQGALRLASADEGRLIVACGRYLREHPRFDPTQVYEVDCLGCLDEAFLIGLAISDVTEVTFVDGDCAGCPRSRGRRVLDGVLTQTEALLSAWEVDSPAHVEGDMPDRAVTKRKARAMSADRGVSRRDFFTDIKGNAKSLAAEVVLEATTGEKPDEGKVNLIELLRVPSGGTMSQFTPPRGEFILGFLDQLGEPTIRTVRTSLWSRVEVDAEKCTLCGMCGVFCPTGAIVKDDASEDPGLDFYPVDCVGCGLCQTACMPHAITLSDEVDLTRLLGCESEHISIDRTAAKGPLHTTKIVASRSKN